MQTAPRRKFGMSWMGMAELEREGERGDEVENLRLKILRLPAK
jgi:hypothetical protein